MAHICRRLWIGSMASISSHSPHTQSTRVVRGDPTCTHALMCTEPEQTHYIYINTICSVWWMVEMEIMIIKELLLKARQGKTNFARFARSANTKWLFSLMLFLDR